MKLYTTVIIILISISSQSMAAEVGWLNRVGAWLRGGGTDRWHRLDIHLAAILAFDTHNRLRLLTLAQHNHQQTFLPEEDFPGDRLELPAGVTHDAVVGKQGVACLEAHG